MNLMGFRANADQQLSFDDRMNRLTEREHRILEKSWAEPFATRIFPLIDELKFSVLYCTDNGRPNTAVNVVIGSLLLKELTRLTDEELLESILFDVRYQRALHLTSCDEIPFSDRTVSRFRERLYKYELETGEDLLKEEIERLSGELSKVLKIQSNVMRMDSLMVSSSCKNMGRLELIYTCISNLVKFMTKAGRSEILPAGLLKYSEDSNKNSVCYRMTKEEVSPRLESVTSDALLLHGVCADIPEIVVTDEYKLLSRMLEDQTTNGQLKPKDEINSRSLQNPSDEDATFRRKSGKGYQGFTANVVEACDDDVNIITHYDYEVNVHSDAEFGADIIEHLGKQEEETILISDGAYASEGNFRAAKANNIELVTTNLTGQVPPEMTGDFQIEGNELKACPAGHSPLDCKYNEQKEEYRAHFDKATCENCSHKEECPVVMQVKRALVRVSQKSIDRAQRTLNLSTEEYKAHARKRNGVEGVPSILRRRYGVDYMPVRGLLRSKMWFGFKIGAINVKRVIAAALNATFLTLFVENNVSNLLSDSFCKQNCFSQAI